MPGTIIDNIQILGDGKFVVQHHPEHQSIIATCIVTVFAHNNQRIVVLTEPKDNRGISVTNAMEYLVTALLNNPLIGPWIGNDPERCIWVEHYPPRKGYGDRFALVNMRWHRDEKGNWEAEPDSAQWQAVTDENLLEQLRRRCGWSS